MFLAALAAGLLVAVGPAAADPSIPDKQAQAQEVMSKVRELYSEQERAVEAYNYAGEQLKQIDRDLRVNGKHLRAAKEGLGHAQRTIAKRLRELYVKGQGDSTLEVLLGSSSLEDVVTRLDAIQRVSRQDARILNDVKRYRREVLDRRHRLEDARKKQAQLVQQRAAERQRIEAQITEQNQLLATIKDQIKQMRIAEQRRQAALAAQARARLEAARLAAQQQAQAAAAQAEAAAAEASTAAAAAAAVADAPPAPPPDGSRASQVVSIAMQYLGVPYVWGGSSPSSGFDCSGFIMYVFAQIGVGLPHHAASQYGYGAPVSREELQPADLVFFDGLGHAGIYIGGGQFIHAPHTGDVVKISSLYEDWYSSTFVGARRLL